MATYQQVRKQIKEQKLGQQFFKPEDSSKGKGYGSSRPSGKPGFKPKRAGQKGSKGESRRIHIEQLKLQHSLQKLRAAGTLIPAAVCWFCFGATFFGGGLSEVELLLDHAPGQASPGNLFYVRRRSPHAEKPEKPKSLKLCPIVVTAEHQAPVDTAAQEGLIGRSALLRLLSVLRPHNLRARWLNKEASARGIGGCARTIGVCELPVGIAGVVGVLETAVIADDVPLLLPVSLLKALGAIVNLPESKFQLTAVHAETPKSTMASGHLLSQLLTSGRRVGVCLRHVRE